MSDFNWKTVIDADMSNVDPEGNPKGPVAPGVYSAFINSIEMEKKESGAYGTTVIYKITDGDEKNRTVKEFICLAKKDGSPLGFGASKLKQRMLNFGLTATEVQNFDWPKGEGRLGGFKNLVDTDVTIEVDHRTVANGDLAGVVLAQIKKVYRPKADSKAASN